MTYFEFEKKWLLHFAKDISEKEIQNHVVSNGNMLWHVFSWELLPKESYLEGEKAKKAYDEMCEYLKEDAIFIEPFEGKDAFSLTQKEATSAKLDRYTEIYAVGKDFSWTYIKTHEGDFCGPYFCRSDR